jgi:MATE family multidrug resistance protein
MKLEIKKLIQLSLPLILAQIGVVLLGVVDMIMLGHYSDEALKAAGLANVWIIGTLMFGIGCCLGVDPIISQSLGMNDPHRAKRGLFNATIMSVFVSIIIAVLWFMTGPLFRLLNLGENFSVLAHNYALVQIPSLIPFFMYMVFRQYLIGHEKTMAVAIVLILTNFVNIGLNTVFIFGQGAFPPMGLFGAGLSTCLMRASQYIFLCLIVYFSKEYKGLWVSFDLKLFDKDLFKRICFLGAPIGTHFMLEAFGLQLTTLFAAKIGENALGGHSILMNLEYLFFILPMAIALSATMRMGRVIGENGSRVQVLLKAVFSTSLLAFGLASISFVIIGPWLVDLYGVSTDILNYAKEGLFAASLFLFFYSFQQVLAGLLRGASKTLSPSITNILCMYLIGLPLSYYMAIDLEYGANGLWLGLAVAMFISCFILLILNFKTSKEYN